MSQTDDLPMIAFASRELWWAWLSENHRSATGIWLQFAKKDSGHASIDHDEALAVAICHDAAYAPQSTSVVPQDLQCELELRPQAYELFRGLDSKNRYAILHRIEDAKRPETRTRRIAKFVAMLDAGEKIYE